MGTFLRRPLTWLFFVAINCVAAAAASRDTDSTSVGVLISAQVILIAGWAAVGRSHRLLRGAMLVAVPLATALAIYAWGAHSDEVRIVLAFVLLAVGIVFAAALLTSVIIRGLSTTQAGGGSRWQISLMEMLGWTLVVAIGSAAVSQAELPPLESIYAPWASFASGAVGGVLVALFMTPGPKHDRASLIVAALVVAAYFAAAVWTEEFDVEDCGIVASLFGVIALAILVQRLDEHAERVRAAAPEDAPLQLHIPPGKDD